MSISNSVKEMLTDRMAKLLDEYDYSYDTDALETIVDTWEVNKSLLLEAFKNHPNFIEEELCIAFDSDYNREINTQESRNFLCYLRNLIWSYDYSIPEEMTKRIEENLWSTNYGLPYRLYYFLTCLESHASRTLSQSDYELLNELVPEIHPHAGEKTSRAVNRLCTYLGYNKDPDYNKEFAKYADSLSPMTIKRHTILSLNPLDYLTMSFGNSWASCHTIDKRNKRGMPNSYSGAYSSGTMSYMLDSTSMVFYTVDKSYDGKEYYTQPKINRQMFHYGEDKLVQGRLYPQGNDGNTDEYTIYRQIVQQVIAQCFNIPNLWTVSKGTEHASEYINSEGTHYRDYNNFDNCTLSKNKSLPNENKFTVGHDPICIECGCTHSDCESINCCTSGYVCADCGCSLDEDDVIWIGDTPYCRDCVYYCECCEEYHVGVEYYIDCENRYVCESCLNEYYTYCDECGEYFPSDQTTEVTTKWGSDGYVCDHCLEYYYEECSECGNCHRHDSMIETYDGDYICGDCQKDYAKCKECEEWYPKSEMTEIAEGVYVCGDCHKEEEEEDDAEEELKDAV